MDIKYLRELVEIFDNSKIMDLEISEGDVTITLSKQVDCAVTENSNYMPQAMYGFNPMQMQPQYFSNNEQSPKAVSEPITSAPTTSNESVTKFHEIASPIVGTFYKAPSPESDPFVEVGSKVKQGDVLCIVEAMKLMNEIECDVNGTIEKILIENGTPVEFNQTIFYIRPE